RFGAGRSHRYRPEPRNAAARRLEPELDPTDDEPRRERIACPCRVDDRRPDGLVFLGTTSGDDRDSAGAALDDGRLAEPVGAADELPLRLVRADDTGLELLQRRPEPLGPVRADRAPRREVHADPCSFGPRQRSRCERRPQDWLREEAVAREMQPAAPGEPA